jgi:hypothetical protein
MEELRIQFEGTGQARIPNAWPYIGGASIFAKGHDGNRPGLRIGVFEGARVLLGAEPIAGTALCARASVVPEAEESGAVVADVSVVAGADALAAVVADVSVVARADAPAAVVVGVSPGVSVGPEAEAFAPAGDCCSVVEQAMLATVKCHSFDIGPEAGL